MLLGKGDARCDARVTIKKAFQEDRTIALSTAVQEDDVIGHAMTQRVSLIKNRTQGRIRLGVGKVAVTVHDPTLEKVGSRTLQLHVGVVVALNRENMQAGKPVNQRSRNVPEIGRVTEPGSV